MIRFAALVSVLGIAVLTSGCSFGNNYGKKLEFKSGEVYYTSNVTEAEAKKLGERLVTEGYFKDTKSTVQLDKADGVYRLRLVVPDDYKQKKGYPGGYVLLGARVSTRVFDGKPVSVQLTDTHLNTVETFDAQTVGSMLPYGKGELIYSHGVTKGEATKVGQFLEQAGYFETKLVTVDLRKERETFQLRFVVDMEQLKKNPLGTMPFRVFGAPASKIALDGKPVEIHLISPSLKTVEVLKPLKAAKTAKTANGAEAKPAQ